MWLVGAVVGVVYRGVRILAEMGVICSVVGVVYSNGCCSLLQCGSFALPVLQRSASVTAFRGVVGLFDAEARHRLYR